MADIKFLVTVDMASGQANLKEFEGEVNKLGTTTKGAGGAAGDAHIGYSKFIGGIAAGTLIANAGQKGLHLFWSELKSIPGSAIEAEQANARLDAALFSTGRQSANLSEHFKKQAVAMMEISTSDDEVIKGAQAMLLSYTNLDAQGIDRATKASMGLAKVFSMDLVSASELVGKWMSGNTDRLTKYGIHVKDTWTEEQKRNEIMRQLLVYYSTVLPQTETYGGKLLQMKNSYKELKEEMGEYFTESVKLDKVVGGLIQGLRDFFTVGKTWREEAAKEEKANADLGNQIWEAAKKAGYSNQQIRDMANGFRDLKKEQEEQIRECKEQGGSLDLITKKIIINNDNLEWAIMTDKKYTAVKIELIKVEKEHAKALAEAERIRKAAEGGTPIGPSPAEMEAEKKRLELVKKLLEEEKKLKADARQWLYDNMMAWFIKEKEAEKKKAEDVKKIHLDARQWLDDDMKKYLDVTKKKLEDEKDAWHTMWQKVQQIAFSGLNTMLNYFSQVQANQNKIISDGIERTYALAQRSMDNYYMAADRALKTDYDRKRRAIEDSKMSEEEKNAALLELETKHEQDIWNLQDAQKAAGQKLADEIEVKRKAAQKAAAIENKNIAIWASLINTAEAITAALTMKPWTPANWVLAAVTAAMGAVQTAFIASQPIPLAKGFEGMVRRPTTFLAGEAGAEWLSVRPGGGGSGKVIHVHVGPFYFGGQKYKEQIIEIIARSSKEGTLKIAAKAIN